MLDDLYPAVTPKHEAGNPTAFTNEVQAAAEHLLSTVDGKPKEVFGGTYSQIKEILGKIHESGYFDQAQVNIFCTNIAKRLFKFLIYAIFFNDYMKLGFFLCNVSFQW